MSISSALHIVNSGLRTTQIQSDVITRNIANAMTEGYTRKSTTLQTMRGQVYVASVDRNIDQLLNRLDRANVSEIARAQTVAEGMATYTGILGQPEDATSPVAYLTEFYNSLQTLGSAPLSTASQLGVLDKAYTLTNSLNQLYTAATALEEEVQLNIRYDVSDVNAILSQIGTLNQRMNQTGGKGVEGAEMRDDLDKLVDKLSEYMQIQADFNSDGAVNIYTSGGTELVVGKRVSTVTYAFGQNALKVGDIDITPGKEGVRGFEGGTLAGLFELATKALPEVKQQLDGLAKLVIDRFAASDDTLDVDEQGLFVDSNLGLGAGQLTGLAARITVNAAVDPQKGGLSSKLVTGMGSKTPLESGSNVLVNKMIKAIDLKDNADTPMGTAISIADYAANMVSRQQQLRVQAENQATQAHTAGATIAASRMNLQGVNIDDEMQQLMVIEKSFAANAKVLTTLQNMLDTLLAAV